MSVEEHQLLELKQWFTTHKFPERVLDRLLHDPGVTDVLDLAVLCDEELQKAGFTPIQLKRFAVLQHKMNDPNPSPSITQLSMKRDDIRREFIAGRFTREEAENYGRAVNAELALAIGPHVNSAELFEFFVKSLDPKPAASQILEVPQVVTFVPPGLFTIKVSRQGESDRFLQTDSNGKLDVKGLPSECSLQPMTHTEPPLPLGKPATVKLPLVAEKTVDVPANATAGQTRFDKSLLRDQFQNVSGTQYDLAPDGAFRGNTIAVWQAYTGEGFTFQEPKNALEKKGFEVVHWHGKLPSVEEFKTTLERCCQLWLLSGTSVTLTEGHIQAVLKFVETPLCEGESDTKKGLFIWGDNDPYFADANAILLRLPFFKRSVSLAGNFLAEGILTEHPAPSAMRAQGSSGFKPHFITTGLESLYEGVTISDVRDPEQLCEPIITCSDKKSHVTCLHNSSTHRVIIDGGMTRLYPQAWGKTAGTSRFVTNAACYLANSFAQ